MLQFKIFQPHQNIIHHGFTLKGEGNFKENQPEFEVGIKKLDLVNVATTYQIHTDQIIKGEDALSRTPDGDALISSQPDITLMIKVADCQAILMFDPITKCIAAIHSGWKSSCLNILGKTVQQLKKEYGINPKNLLVGISPSLGPCCCEFSNPLNELPSFIHPFILDNHHVDFWQLSLKELTDEGVLKENIEFAKECTKCHPEKYYSHRNKDGQRMGAFIKLKN